MKKWICEKCSKKHPCILMNEAPDATTPSQCVYGQQSFAEWESVSDLEQAGNFEQLPEWCEHDAWIFDHNETEYAQVKELVGDVEYVHLIYADKPEERVRKSHKYIIDCCLEARLRPYSDREMQLLVGDILEIELGRVLVTAYHPAHFNPKLKSTVFLLNEWFTADELLKSYYTLNGKPCGVFEFYDEGEWHEI